MTNISARIEEDVKNILEAESEIQQISFNSLLNKILKKHVQWDRFTQEIGMTYISKSVFRNLLSKIDDNDLKVIATSSCRSAMRDAVIYIERELTLQSFIGTLDLWLSASHIPFRHSVTNDGMKYIIQHNLGVKYSTYLQTSISALLSEIQYGLREISTSDHNVIFEIYPVI